MTLNIFFTQKGLPGSTSGKESAFQSRDIGDGGFIPGSGRSSEGGIGNPLQYSCLDNSMDRGTWWATVHGITESDTTEQLALTYLTFSRYSIDTSSKYSASVCSSVSNSL